MDIRHLLGTLTLALALAALPGCDGGDQEETGERAEPAAEAPESGAPDSAGAPAPAEETEDGSAPGDGDRMAAAGTGGSGSGSEGNDSPAGEDAANALGCTACHAAQTQLVGPSYQAVADKYGGDKAKILEVMKAAVENGASGTWAETTGGTPMPPQPQATGKTEQLNAIAEWIAAMAK